MSDQPASPDDAAPRVKKAWDLVDEAKAMIDNLTPAELDAERSADDVVVVDIRDFRELYGGGKIPGAVHAPRGMLEFWIDPESEYYRDVFSPDRRYLLYCAAGGRSALAAKVMKDMGYPDVGHLEAGFAGWSDAGLDVESVQDNAKWVPRST